MMNIAKMMQQAKRMQDDMKTMQDKLKDLAVDVSVSGVAATMSGDGILKSLVIDKALVNPEDKETLEDVIIAVLNQLREKREELVASETQKIMGGMQLPPGFQLPF